MVNACLLASFEQHVHRAIHFHAALELVEIPDAFGSLPGDLGGINMGVNVDDVHKIASIAWIFLSYHKNRENATLPPKAEIGKIVFRKEKVSKILEFY
jgi:hypothetical protein